MSVLSHTYRAFSPWYFPPSKRRFPCRTLSSGSLAVFSAVFGFSSVIALIAFVGFQKLVVLLESQAGGSTASIVQLDSLHSPVWVGFCGGSKLRCSLEIHIEHSYVVQQRYRGPSLTRPEISGTNRVNDVEGNSLDLLDLVRIALPINPSAEDFPLNIGWTLVLYVMRNRLIDSSVPPYPFVSSKLRFNVSTNFSAWPFDCGW